MNPLNRGLPESQLFNGLFGEKNQPIAGDSFILDPGKSSGNEGYFFSKDYDKFLFLTAVQKYNMMHSSMTVSAFPISNPITGLYQGQQVLQLKLSFISGNSNFGDVRDPPSISGGITLVNGLRPDIIIDAHNAVISLTAASSFRVRFYTFTKRYTTSGPFIRNEPLGVTYRVNAGFSYGTPKSIQSWCTDITQEMVCKNGTGVTAAVWAKPQFAEALTLDLNADIENFSGYILLNFKDANYNDICWKRYTAPFSTFPLIRWPSNAYYVRILTSELVSSTPNDVVLLNPVHAILF
jgi:hypothetical protein